MKKILFVHLLNDYSGSPKVLSQVILACQSKKIDFDLFTSQGNGFLSSFESKLKVVRYRWSKHKLITLFRFMRAQVQLFYSVFRCRENEIVYINTMLPFGAALAAKVTGKNVFYHIHETSFRSTFFKSFLRLIAQITADKVVFVSDFLKEKEGFKKIRQYVVHNAVHESIFLEGARSSYAEKQKDPFVVLMACSLKPYKGVNEFIVVAKACCENPNLHFKLVLNAEREQVERYFNGVVLPANLTILSAQEDMLPFYRQASLLLNLSHVDGWVETFGLTIIEAMAFGIPVIVPPVGGPAEIVTDGQEGFLIFSHQVERIAEKIRALSVCKDEYLRLSENARKRAADFRQTDFDKKILEVIYG